MLGTFRYLLALLVVHGHIHWSLADQMNWVGWYSVNAFFVLSGFLMTRVLHESYGYSSKGMARFLFNRVLRIYPAYWIAVLAAAAVLLSAPHNGTFQTTFFLPPDAYSWAWNLLIFGMRDHQPALVGPAWSLQFEWVYYLVMAFGASCSRRMTLAWVGVGLVWTAWAVASGFSLSIRFGTEVAASLPFSLGAAIYFFRRPFPTWAFVVPLGFCVHALLASALWSDVRLEGFYASLLLAAASVYVLAEASAPARFRAWDRRLGDLSYPIFLLHIPVAYLLVSYDPAIDADLWRWFLTTALVVHLPALLIQRLVEIPIESLRGRIRALAKHSEKADIASAWHGIAAAAAPIPSNLVVLTGAAMALLHVGLYRVLAYKLPADHAELLVGVAVAGLGIGVLASALLRGRVRVGWAEFTQRALVSAAIVIASGLFVIARPTIDPSRLEDFSAGLLPWLGVAIVLFGMFIVSGVAIGALLRDTHARPALGLVRLLLGTAIGSTLATLGVQRIGAPGLVLAAAVLLLIPLLWNTERKGRVCVAMAWLTTLVIFPTAQPWIRAAPTKAMHTPLELTPPTDFTGWGRLRRIDAFRSTANPNLLLLFGDGNRATSLPISDSDAGTTAPRTTAVERLPYAAAAARSAVLVLGSGAAAELDAALEAGAANVTTVDPEPLARKILVGALGAWTGALVSGPAVSVLSEDPRSWMESMSGRFEVIRWTNDAEESRPASIGAAHLDSGSFLRTAEGLSLCLNRLQPDGFLAATFADSDGNGARSWLRAARLALMDSADSDIGAHVVIVRAEPMQTLFLLWKSAPAPSTLNRIRALAANLPGAVLVHTPEQRVVSGPLAPLLRPPTALRGEAFVTTAAATEDSPFRFGAGEIAAAVGFAAPSDAVKTTRTDAITARLLFTQAILAIVLAFVGTLAANVRGAGTRGGHRRKLAAASLGGVGFALAAAACVQAITLARGSLVEGWTLTMTLLPIVGATLLLFVERFGPSPAAEPGGDDTAAPSAVLRCGVFLCWFAAGSPAASLIAISSGFAATRWIAAACLLTATLCSKRSRDLRTETRA